jgi:hypothetical protein
VRKPVEPEGETTHIHRGYNQRERALREPERRERLTLSVPRQVTYNESRQDSVRELGGLQVRFCRDRFSPTGEKGYSGISGAEG